MMPHTDVSLRAVEEYNKILKCIAENRKAEPGYPGSAFPFGDCEMSYKDQPRCSIGSYFRPVLPT
jgi:hypothetical protein